MKDLSGAVLEKPDIEALKNSKAVAELTELLSYQGPEADVAENLEVRVSAATALAEVSGARARTAIEQAYAAALDLERTLGPALELAARWPLSPNDKAKNQRTAAALETAKQEFARLLRDIARPQPSVPDTRPSAPAVATRAEFVSGMKAASHIEARRDEVWSVFTDPRTWSMWYGGTLAMVDPAWRAGATLRWGLGAPSTVREYDDHARVQVVSVGGIVSTWSFDDDASGTRVTVCADYSGSNVVVNDPEAVRQRLTRQVTGLKTYVEEQHQAPDAAGEDSPADSSKPGAREPASNLPKKRPWWKIWS